MTVAYISPDTHRDD